MDEQQVWQQLELRNDVVLPQILEQTAKLLAVREQNFEIRLKENENNEEDEEDGEQNENDNEDSEPENDTNSELEDDSNDENFGLLDQNKPKKKLRSSIVDDKFFKMEEFLQAEDEKDLRKRKGKSIEEDDDGIDYFADDFGESEEDDSAKEDETAGNYNLKYENLKC